MSRSTIRAAVASYLSQGAGTSIPYLSNVYPHPAKFTPEGDFFVNEDPGHNTGAVIFLYIGKQMERRAAMGGPTTGRKVVEYELIMDCFIRSAAVKSENCGADSDTFLDALVTYIRADRNAGTAATSTGPYAGTGYIFQWGEGTFPGGEDIDIQALYPRTLKGSGQITQVYASVRTAVLEIANS